MARLDLRPLDSMPELHSHFENTKARAGYLPNSQLTMARVPGLVEAVAGLGKAAFGNDLLQQELKTMLGLISSVASGCRYCQAHTATMATTAGVAEVKLAEVWTFETSDLFTDAERAALRLAFHAGQVPNAATDADFDALRQHFTDDQIAAIVAVVSFFGFFNRWNDTMATTLEEVPEGLAESHLAAGGWEKGKH